MLEDEITAIRTNRRVMLVNVPHGRVMSKMAFIPHSGGQRSSPISLLIWLPMDHYLVGLLDENEGRIREGKKKSHRYQESRGIF